MLTNDKSADQEYLLLTCVCAWPGQSYLEEEEEIYECFTGWEPDGANDGYSATVGCSLNSRFQAAPDSVDPPPCNNVSPDGP